MCGLVAMFTFNKTRFSQDDIDGFKTALWYDTVRGKDSTGVFFGNVDDNEVYVAKQSGNAALFLSNKLSAEFMTEAYRSADFVVGHNRAATRGAVTDDNAHPFTEGPITLVHNGTLRGGHKHLADTEVDSHAICHLLAAHEDPNDALKQIYGAYALIWYDQRNKTLNFVRNSERPLWMMKDKKTNTFYLSSEPYIIAAAMFHEGIQVTGMEEIKPYELHTVNLSSTNVDIVRREVERYTPKFQGQSSYKQSQSYWPHAYDGLYGGWTEDDYEPPFSRVAGTESKATGTNTQQQSKTENSKKDLEDSYTVMALSADYACRDVVIEINNLHINDRFSAVDLFPWYVEGVVVSDRMVKCVLPVDDESIEELNSCHFAKATVGSVKNDPQLGPILMLVNPKGIKDKPVDTDEEVVSRNNRVIKYSQYVEQIPECRDCGVEVQFHELKDCKVLMTSKKIRVCVCKNCCTALENKAKEAANDPRTLH